MNQRMLTLFAAALFALVIASSAQANPKIEQALRNLDDQWSQAAGAKDLDKTVSFYSDTAIVLPPNESACTTQEAIKTMWKGFLDSVSSISWKVTKVEVAKAGDMAYVTGTYETSTKDSNRKDIKDRGKYLEVWRKQTDGKWKCSADMFSSDLPAK